MTPEDASREARKRFGNFQSIREDCREACWVTLGEATWQDIRFALRLLGKNPGFTTVALTTLTAGIGANTALFSVVNAVLFRPMPYPDPDRLVAVCESNPRLGLDRYVASMGAYADWGRQNSVFQELAAATVLSPAPVVGRAGADLVHVAAVSADFFPMLGLHPILGRGFVSEEESPDRGNVVLLSEDLWRARFGADPGILHQSVRVGGNSFTIVGVMPASVKLFDPAGVQGWDQGFSKSGLWRPLPVDSGLRKQRSYRAFLVLGRFKPNVSIARARADMVAIARDQEREYPDSNAGWTITVESWSDTVVRNVRLPLMLLWGAVIFVLLITTANLANLCLARAASRKTEFSIRLALGAGRLRLARQLLAESLLLSVLGGAAGLLFARWGLGFVCNLIPSTVPRTDEINLDGCVFAFTFATALLVGAIFGLAPLLALWRGDRKGGLRPETRGLTGTPGGGGLRVFLVASEVALVVVLLTGAGLLTRSFRCLNRVNLGFRPAHLAAFDLSFAGPGFTNETSRIQVADQLLARLSDLPGVDSAAAVDGLPLDVGHANMDIALTSIEGTPPVAPEGKVVAGLCLVSSGYFQTMGISLAHGRVFSEADNTKAPPVVVINETLARRFFPGQDPVGKRIGSPDLGSLPCEIVGVVQDVTQTSLRAGASPQVFRPLFQECFSSLTIVVRSAASLKQTLALVSRAAKGGNIDLPLFNPRTLDQLISASTTPLRFAMRLMGLFAGLALLLALVGIYGVLSWSVKERTREIGVRLALGARRGEVFRLTMMQGMRSVAIGGVIGMAGICALTRVLRSVLYSVSPTDSLTLAVVALLIGAAAFAACWFPASRAASVNPVEALRHQ